MQTRLIKKYPNRKLYCTTESRYLVLSEVQDLIKDGVDLKVIDHKNRLDITDHTLMSIIEQNELSTKSKLPHNFMIRVLAMDTLSHYAHNLEQRIPQ